MRIEGALYRLPCRGASDGNVEFPIGIGLESPAAEDLVRYAPLQIACQSTKLIVTANTPDNILSRSWVGRDGIVGSEVIFQVGLTRRFNL